MSVLSDESKFDEHCLVACQRSEREWLCPIAECCRVLSRKQTLKSHLSSVHNVNHEVPSKRYKHYEYDPSYDVPRTTSFNRRKRKLDKDSHDDPASLAFTSSETLEVFDQPVQSVDNSSDMDILTDSDRESESEDSELSSGSSIVDIDNKGKPDKKLETSWSAPLYVVESSTGEIFSSDISNSDHALAVTAFSTRHNLSDTATEHLMQLLNLHLPESNLVDKNVSTLKEKLGFDADFMNYFSYCSVCNCVLEGNVDHCTTPNCQGGMLSKQPQTYFCTSNIEIQLREILNRKGVMESIHEVFDRQPHSTITDITDGTEYQKLRENGGFLSDKNNITVTMFTDGIPLFKSSGVSLWPVYLLINELPRHDRFRKKNMVLWGMWQGTGKPNMTMFLKPLVAEFQQLYINGFNVCIESNEIICKAMLVVCTMDLQARAAVLHMTQHNGENSCVYCMHTGRVVKSGKGHCRCFPYTEVPLPMRTADEILADGRKAQKDRKKVNGFTGESVLNYLPDFTLNNNIVIDYMHGILLGITKKLLSLWFDSKHAGKEYYIGTQIKKVDKLLKAITPPYTIKRLPRKLSNTMHHWKASELRSWLLFYSLPVLLGTLPEKYLEHFSYLAEGTYILMGEGITENEIVRAESLLNEFVKLLAGLYGESVVGLNVHNLLHLCDCVRKWGPLWAWSCFCFESFNGEIKKSVHGTGNVCKQIFWTILAQKRVENIASLNVSGPVKSYIENLSHHSLDSNMSSAFQCSVAKTSTLPQDFHFPDDVRLKLFSFVNSNQVEAFLKTKKIARCGYTFYSKSCSKVKRRNSYTSSIETTELAGFIEIDYFILHISSRHVFAVGRLLQAVGGVLPTNALHIQQVTYLSPESSAVRCTALQDIVVSFDLNGAKYVSRFPNTVESD